MSQAGEESLDFRGKGKEIETPKASFKPAQGGSPGNTVLLTTKRSAEGAIYTRSIAFNPTGIFRQNGGDIFAGGHGTLPEMCVSGDVVPDSRCTALTHPVG